MNKNTEKLVELRVKQTEAQKRLEAAANDDELNAAQEELRTLSTDIKAVEDEISAVEAENKSFIEERAKGMNTETKVVKTDKNEDREAIIKAREERAQALREGRSVTIASSSLLVPEYQSDEIATYPFQPASSLVDLVNVVPLEGGETYEKAFVKSYGTAGLTTEGSDYTTAEPTFGYATVSKAKVTAYAEISEEVLKLASLDYEAEVVKGCDVAIKKKFSQQIIAGAGTTNTFKGITAASVEALEDTDEVEVSAITNTTLDNIIYAFGGDEEVLGAGALILNKLDLKAFATLRDNEGKRVYTVDYNAKTIDGIPYVINSNLPALSAAGTAAETTCMLFGTLKGYEVALFSPVEITRSTDFKFKQGIVCYKAVVFAGGNVGAYRSFIKVTKVS